MAIVTFSLSVISVQAYDTKASHTVNDNSVNIDDTKSKIWKTVRSWGYSEAATAGIMGNMEAECGYNYTKVQGNKDWSNFKKGTTGIGLNQWTTSDRQQGLFDLCDSKGVQWTDLDTQLSWLSKELDGVSGETDWWKYGDNCKSLDEFKSLNNIYTATDVFCWGFERPNSATADVERRRNSAKAAYEQFTGTEVSTSPDGKEINSNLIVDEWDLTGMPAKSGLLNDIDGVVLPSYDNLEDNEKYSLSIVKDDIMSN